MSHAPLVGFTVILVLYTHYFREFSDPLTALIGLVGTHLLVWGLVSARLSRTRTLLAAMGLVVLPWVLRGALFLVLRLATPERTGPWDLAYPLFDRYLLLLSPPLALYAVSLYAGARLPWLEPWRGILHLGLFLVVLSLPGFRLGEDPGDIWRILVLSGSFLFWELEQVRRHHRRRAGWLPPPWVLGALPLLAAGLGLAYTQWTERKAGEEAGLLQPSLFGYDLSSIVRLENRIAMPENLIFVLRKDGPPASLLLRRQVLNAYHPDRGFFADPRWLDPRESALNLREGGLLLPEPPGRLRRDLTYDVLAVGLDPDSVLAVNEPSSVERLIGYDPRRFRGAYRVTSRVLPPNLARVARNPQEAGVSREYWDFHLQVPRDLAIEGLAREVTRGLIDPTRKVERLNEYFHQEFFYSLAPSVPPGADPLRHFLFESRRGYCSYFAFSMVLMLRHLGIPSRLAVGFFTDPQRQVLGYYPVRGFQAHAWVEVLGAGEGWIPYDPTTDRLAPDEELSFRNELPDDFFELVESLLAQELLPAEGPRRVVETSVPSNLDWVWPLAVAAALVLGILAWRLRWPLGLLWKRDHRERIGHLYRWARARLAASTPQSTAHLSPTEFARLFESDTFDELTRLHLEAAYSDHAIGTDRWRRCLWLWERLPRPHRHWRLWRWP